MTYWTQPAPADATGVYPALTGYTPMDTGRRVVVALVDGLLFAVFYTVMIVAALALPRNTGDVVGWIVLLAYSAAALWAIVGKSARLGGLLTNAQYVDVVTGLPSGGKLLGKFLLQGLISGVSLGIAPLVMYFATIQEPLKRNWFDRTLGLMLVDTRTGRRPGEPLPVAPVAPPQPTIAPVTFSSAPAPVQPWGSAQTPPAAPVQPWASAQTPPPAPPQPWASTQTPPPAAPAAEQYPAASPFSGAPTDAIRPVLEDGAIITSTPGSRPVPTAPQAPEPPVPARPVIREPSRFEVEESDRTVLSADSELAGSGGGLRARLDDGSLISLSPPTVIGRNPSAPGSHPDAATHPVDDPQASKTHLLLGQDERGPWVMDLHSTNGVRVALDGSERRIEAGRKVSLPAGAAVLFGTRRISVGP